MNKKIQTILTALALVLDLIGSLFFNFVWLNGGSVSIAMLPILICGLRHKTEYGLLSGLLVGLIQLMWSKNYGPISIFLDYIIAYTVIGLIGLVREPLLKRKKWNLIYIFTIIFVFILRLSAHVISGMIVFEATFWFSLSYNFSYLSISMFFSSLILWILIKKTPYIIFSNENNSK